MADLQFSAELDVSQPEQELENLSKEFDSVAKRGDDAFNSLGKAPSRLAGRLDAAKKRAAGLRQELERVARDNSQGGGLGGFLDDIIGKLPGAGSALAALGPIAAGAGIAISALTGVFTATFNRAQQAIEPFRKRLRFRAEAREFKASASEIETAIDNLTGKTLTREKIVDLGAAALELDDFGEKLEELSQQEFGRPAESLTEVERSALAAEIAIDAARDAGELFASSFDDAGAPIERFTSEWEDLKTQISETALILTDSLLRGLFVVRDRFAGVVGELSGFTVASENLLQKITTIFLAGLGGLVQGTISALAELKTVVENVFADPSLLLDPAALANRITDTFQTAFVDTSDEIADKLKERFDILGEGIGDGFVGSIDEAADELAGETEKALKKLEDLETKHQRALDDITTRGAAQRLENEIRASQKREDIQQKSLDRIVDARKKFDRDVEKAGRGLSQDEARLVRKQGRERIKLEKDLANEQIDIEREFQQQLRDIRQDFALDEREAAIRGDFATLRRLRRRREQAVDSAQQERTDSIQEAQIEADRRRQILRQEQADELNELRIRNRERLNELRIRLDQELADIRTAKERELSDAADAERRKTEALDRELERRREAERLANERRLTDFKASLSAEVRALVEAEQRKTAEAVKEAARRNDKLKRLERDRQRIQRRSISGIPLSRRQFGGPVIGGQSVTVGEAGPEVFTPSVSGSVLPSSRLGRLPAPISNLSTSNIDNSIQATVNQSMLDPSEQNAIMRSIARAEAQRVLENVLRR